MIYLLLAIASSAMVSISMRLSEGRASGEISMLVVNYLVCLTMAGMYMGVGNLIPREEGLLGGGGDAMSKIYEEFGNPALSEHFLFFIFAVALVLCIGLMLYKKERLGWKDLVFGLLVGIPNYFSARFLLKALGYLPAVIVYPTYSVATICVVTLTGLVFFREKLGKRQRIAIGMILAALVLLNI